MKYCKDIFIVAALASLPLGVQAQFFVTVDDLLRMADEGSASVKAAMSGAQAATQGVEAAKSLRLPEVSADLSFSYIGDGWLADRSFGESMRVDMPHYGNNFALRAQQVVYAGGAVSSAVRMAEIEERQATLSAEQTRQGVRLMALGQYLEIYKLMNQKRVYEQNIALTERLIEHTQVRHEQGTALKNDITRQELRLEELRLGLTRVENAKATVTHALCNTLGLPTGTEIVPDTCLDNHPSFADMATLEHWQSVAEGSNLGLRQAATGVEMAGQAVKAERSALLPKVAIVAEEHLDGPILIEVPTIDKNFNYWFVGVGVKYDLSSLWRSNKSVRRAKTLLRQSEERRADARLQVDNAVQADYTAYRQSFTELATQRKSVQLARENYAVVYDRYTGDLALVTDMIDASNMKLQAELLEVNARINVIYTYYKLTHTAGTL